MVTLLGNHVPFEVVPTSEDPAKSSHALQVLYIPMRLRIEAGEAKSSANWCVKKIALLQPWKAIWKKAGHRY